MDICTFKWKPATGYRSKFGPEAVNVLASMVRRHYQKPHRFTCITDDPKGIDSNIRIVPLWSDYGNLPSAYGSRNPSCYRRLKLFSAEAKELIGPRFVSLDLDMVITGDLSPLWDRTDDFIIWKSPTPPPRYLYNGSMMLMTAGVRKAVWESFHPVKSVQETRAKRMFGSDQAWISLKLGPGEKTWDEGDGVYSFRLQINRQSLPDKAKAVIFHGEFDPWDKYCQQIDWVRANYH